MGPPSPRGPSPSPPAGVGGGVQARCSVAAPSAAGYKWLLSLSSFLGLSLSPVSFSCWFSLLLLKT